MQSKLHFEGFDYGSLKKCSLNKSSCLAAAISGGDFFFYDKAELRKELTV